MRTAADYRKEAAGYVLQAENVADSRRRLRLLEMAQSCLRLADQADLLEASSTSKGPAAPDKHSGL